MSFFDALPLIASHPLNRTEYAKEYAELCQLGSTWPFVPHALYRLSHLYRFAGRKDIAAKLVDLAFELPHDRPDAIWHRAQERIRRRDWGGWAEYQSRWADPNFQAGHKYAQFFDAAKYWNGIEDLRDKTLLVIGEQGFGDTIQMLRYLPAVRPLVGNLKATVQPALRKLVWAAYGDILEPAEPMPNPAHDRHIGIMSLPGLLGPLMPGVPFSQGDDRTPTAIYTQGAVTPEGMTMPLKFTGPVGDLGGTGLVWRGNPLNNNDQNRSMPKAEATRLFDALRLDSAVATGPFYSFQIGDGEDWFNHRFPSLVHEHYRCTEAARKDWFDTAKALMRVDRLVTIDSAVMHLAGSLGVETWGLLTYAHDWRFPDAGEFREWYPSVRLIRQPSPGDWAGAIEALLARMSESVIAEPVRPR